MYHHLRVWVFKAKRFVHIFPNNAYSLLYGFQKSTRLSEPHCPVIMWYNIALNTKSSWNPAVAVMIAVMINVIGYCKDKYSSLFIRLPLDCPSDLNSKTSLEKFFKTILKADPLFPSQVNLCLWPYWIFNTY